MFSIDLSSILLEICVFRDYALLILGLLLYVLGWTVFLVPNNLVGGGVTGVTHKKRRAFMPVFFSWTLSCFAFQGDICYDLTRYLTQPAQQ